MTQRLYHTDSYQIEFDAMLLAVEQIEDGRRAALLDRTLFYPTSGGQPFDTGTLGAARVVEVVDAGDRGILHVVDGDLAEGPVHGRINWARRFDHMQQHTGQHVLSAAFDRLLGARTESFHLGSGSSTIDLSKDVSPDGIALAESEANRIVWEDRAVMVRVVEADVAAILPLRKPPARQGPLRLVDVDGFDLSACGGTHVARTGAIGTIAVASWDRFRGGTRVEFLCGVRTLRGFRALRDSVAESVRLISVLPAELPAGIERLQTEAKELKRRVRDLQVNLASWEAGALAERAETFGDLRVVAEALEGWDPGGLKGIASAIAERPRHVALLVSTPPPLSLVVARAPDVPVDSAAVLRSITAKFGGKGGGRPDFAQGGGLNGSVQEVLAFARTLLESLIPNPSSSNP